METERRINKIGTKRGGRCVGRRRRCGAPATHQTVSTRGRMNWIRNVCLDCARAWADKHGIDVEFCPRCGVEEGWPCNEGCDCVDCLGDEDDAE